MNALLLLLGGNGERFGGEIPKQFLNILHEGKKMPLFECTARKILAALPVNLVVFVCPPGQEGSDNVTTVLTRLKSDFPERTLEAVAGGNTRFASFLSGLSGAEKQAGIKRLLVHDANRPYLNGDFMQRVAARLDVLSPELPAFIPVVSVVDSIVRLDGDTVHAYENRAQLKRVQTPQLIHYETFAAAYGASRRQKDAPSGFTDEGSLCLALGLKVGYFEGDPENAKITYPADLMGHTA